MSISFSGVSIELKDLESAIVVKIYGFLDTYNSTDFFRYISKEVLDNKEYKKIIFDMEEVNYISSTGIGALVQVMKVVSADGDRELHLLNTEINVRNVIDLLGFRDFFEFCEGDIKGCLDS